MSRTRRLEIGAWYVPRRGVDVPRWVLAVINGRVTYSKGGTRHFSCNRSTFVAWIRLRKAHRAVPSRRGVPKLWGDAN